MLEYVVGRTILIIGGLLLALIIIGSLTYWVYNLWLIKILDWNNDLSRKEFLD